MLHSFLQSVGFYNGYSCFFKLHHLNSIKPVLINRKSLGRWRWAWWVCIQLQHSKCAVSLKQTQVENQSPKTHFPISAITDVDWRVRINWSWAGTETSQSLAGFGDGQEGAKLQPSHTQNSKTAPRLTYRNCLFLLFSFPWALCHSVVTERILFQS